MKTSDEIGGSDVTRRLRLYRLNSDQSCISQVLTMLWNSLPVSSHMASLQVAVSKRHLTSVAGIWMSGNSTVLRSSCWDSARSDGSHNRRREEQRNMCTDSESVGGGVVNVFLCSDWTKSNNLPFRESNV